MVILYLSVEKEIDSNRLDIPHEIIFDILSEVYLKYDRNSEKKTD